jgi:iduronate 2-sulfatase
MWDCSGIGHGLRTCRAVAAPFAAAVWLATLAATTQARQPYNVLFIAADDLRTDLGCYGHPLVETPHLDRLAQRGLVFDRAYCQQAVCNPSRASVMTGRRVDSLRVWDLRTHFRDTVPDVVTLPEHFKNHGYFTQNVGKIYHNWIHQLQGDPQSWSVPAQLHFASHGSDKPQLDRPLPANLATDPKCECRDVPDEAYFDGRVARLAVQALRECAAARQPFFLAVGYWKPHAPFNAPKRYWDLYRRDQIVRPINSQWPVDAPRIAWHDSREILGAGSHARELSDEAMQEIRHGYLANVSYLDAQVGKVLDELESLQLTQRTIVVFWSDHGFHLGEHTLWAKTSNFELDARVPLIIAVPDALRAALPGAARSNEDSTPGSPPPGPGHERNRTESLVELLDLYPTLVELCGLARSDACEGVSLVPLLVDPRVVVRQAALSQHPRPAYFQDAPTAMGYSIRTATHRYTEWRDWQTGETTAREFYDHRHDPGETVNVAGDLGLIAETERHATLLNALGPVVTRGWQDAPR